MPLISMGLHHDAQVSPEHVRVGIATQDPVLRARLPATPRAVINFVLLYCGSKSHSTWQARLQTVDEMVAAWEKIEAATSKTRIWKAKASISRRSSMCLQLPSRCGAPPHQRARTTAWARARSRHSAAKASPPPNRRLRSGQLAFAMVHLTVGANATEAKSARRFGSAGCPTEPTTSSSVARPGRASVPSCPSGVTLGTRKATQRLHRQGLSGRTLSPIPPRPQLPAVKKAF